MNANLLKLCANLVEILSLEAPPSRAVAITLRLVQVTTVSLINDDVNWLRLAVFAGACVKHEMAKRPNGTPVSLNSTSVSLNGVLIQCKLAKAIVGC